MSYEKENEMFQSAAIRIGLRSRIFVKGYVLLATTRLNCGSRDSTGKSNCEANILHHF